MPQKFAGSALLLLVGAALLACRGQGTQTTNSAGTGLRAKAVLPSGSALWKSFSLVKLKDGIDGRLELLVDAQIQSPGGPAMGVLPSCNPCAPVDGSPVPQWCAPLAPRSLARAKVRLVTSSGEVIALRELECPMAQITQEALRAHTGPAYAVTVALSTEEGAYTGPLTRFAEVVNGKLEWLTATDSQTKETREVELTSTGKSAWTLSPHKGGTDILVAAGDIDSTSPPSEGGAPQVTLLIRYHFDKNRWVRVSRTEPGFWESGNEFPERKRFP